MKIKDIVTFVSKSITPQKGVTYNLYSLPSFDEGKTFEVLDGADIQSNKYDVPNKCILFNKLNVRFKRVWRIDSQDENKIASTEFLPLVVDEDVVDFQYCYYLLISDKITNYLCGQNTNTSGSHKRIDPDNFLNIEIKLPKMSIQRQIGKTLSALDRKIVLNKQINDNLEAMAKQLYDYWFVQFDFPNEEGKPYKSSGGAMVWNEKLKREIPKEWMASNYTDLFTIGNGQTMPQNEGLVPAYGGNGIVKMVEISNYPACIIIGRVGANCGSIHYSKVPCWVSDNAISICSKNDDWQPFLFYSLKLYNLSKNKGGSSQPLITHEALKHLYFPMSEKHINQFCHIVNELQDLIYSNQQEILKLTKQRDELLPLLMNGQASVNYHLSDD